MISYLEIKRTLKNKLVFLCLLATSCLSTDSLERTEELAPLEISRRTNELYLDKSFFTFVILADSIHGPSVGCGFIAEHALYTAKHVLKNQYKRASIFDAFSSDVAIMGTTLVKGLEICKERHSHGDMLFYTVKGKNIDMKISSVTMHKYTVNASSNIKPGDSGSPVFCTEHSRVAGLVSAYWSEKLGSPNDGGTRGIIATLRPNNFEPIGYYKR